MDLALITLQRLICHKTQTNKQKNKTGILFFLHLFQLNVNIFLNISIWDPNSYYHFEHYYQTQQSTIFRTPLFGGDVLALSRERSAYFKPHINMACREEEWNDKQNFVLSELLMRGCLYFSNLCCLCHNLPLTDLMRNHIYQPYLPNPSARAGYDTRSILKRSLTGLNSEFSLS